MQVGFIHKEVYDLFASLLLPRVAGAIEKGEPITALGLVDDDVACGAIAGYIEDEIFHIISLYVAPKYRSLGGGSLLVKTLTDVLTSNDDLIGMDCSFTTTNEEHKTLFPLMEKFNFLEQKDDISNIYRITLEDIAGSDFFSTAIKNTENIHLLNSLPDNKLHQLEHKLHHVDAPMPEQGLHGRVFEHEISVVYTENHDVKALVLFNFTKPNRLELSFAWSEAAPMVIKTLFLVAFHRAHKIYPPETMVSIQSINQTSAGLIQHILPKATPVSHQYELIF